MPWSKVVVNIALVSVEKEGELTPKPKESKLSLVIKTARRALEKIHEVTSVVLKDLYESSKVLLSSSFGGLNSLKARLTVASN